MQAGTKKRPLAILLVKRV